MTKYNAKNERVKREYFRFQAEAQGKAQSTLDGISKALSRFEGYTKYKDFSTFNKEQAIGFKKKLSEQKNERTGALMSKSTLHSTLNALKEFFKWLAFRPRYKSRIYVPDVEYFNLTDKEISIAKAAKHKIPPTLEQIRKVIFSMPVNTDIQRRNRALIAFAILTGMRDGALASLCLKHIDTHLTPPLVRQEPDVVKTKFSKQIFTYFFPVGDDIQGIALDWIKELRENKLYSLNDPVFPKTGMGHDENRNFTAIGVEPKCWSNATPIRKVFKEAFETAGLPYFNPHSFRSTLAHIGQERCRTPEQLKAWSQNLGHESVLTTFTSYGNIDPHRQGDVIRGIGRKEEDKMELILRELQRVQSKGRS